MADKDNKIIDPAELTSAQRAELINKTLVLPEGEKPDFELKSTEPEKQAEQKFEHPFEIKYVKPGEKPSEEDDGTPPPDDAEPSADEKAKGELYTNLIKAYPDFKEKYKNLDEWIAATGTEKEPPAGGEPGPGEKPPAPAPVLTAEQREDLVIDKAYQFFSNDSTVIDLLNKIGVTFDEGRKTPLTFEDWQKLNKEDMEKNGSTFASSQLLTMFNKHKSNVETQLQKIEKTAGDKETLDGTALTEFVSTIEKTAKGLFPKITKKDAEPLVTKMREFFNKNQSKPEYNKMIDGIPVLDSKALISGFINENVEILGGIAQLAAKKTTPSLKEKLEEQSKNGGKSIKTLGNQGHNSGSEKKGFLDNPKDREQLSSKERKKILEAMNQEIANL